MLEWDVCGLGGLEPKWRRELQMMLMLNIKFEMQILDEDAGGGLIQWLVKTLNETMETRQTPVDMCTGDNMLF